MRSKRPDENKKRSTRRVSRTLTALLCVAAMAMSSPLAVMAEGITEAPETLAGFGAAETVVTEAPAATEAPEATETPAVTEAPGTEVPATEAPAVTEAPGTETPSATEAPATENPGTEVPSEVPATEESESEPESETEEQITYNNTSLSGNDAAAGFLVELQYDASAQIPDGSTLQVNDLSADADTYNNYLNAAEATFAPDEGVKVVYADFLNITITDKKGNKVEPQTAVSVKVTLTSAAQISADTILTIHYPDAGGAPEEVACTVNGVSPSFAKRVMAAPKAQAAESTITLNSVSFSASSFSVYGVIGTEPIRRTYVFHNADGSEYIFKDEDGNKTSKQIIKNGESLQDPGIPVGTGEFLGWYTKDDNGNYTESPVAIGSAISFTDEASSTINVYARFSTDIIVSYHDEDGKVFKTEKVEKNTAYTPAADYTSTKAGGDWTCVGWSTEKDILPENRTAVSSIQIEETSVDLYPVVKQAHWINFDGQGADKNVNPVYVLSTDKVPSSLPTPERNGYTFQGWYQGDTQFTDADGNVLAENQTKLTEDITLTAHWKGAETEYTIIYWLQDADDDNYKAADDGLKSAKGYAGEMTDVKGTEDGFTVPKGFHLREKDPVENQIIRGDGSTVVNVYYDRDICTIKFYNESAISNGGYARVTDVNKIQDGKTYYKRGLFGGSYTAISAAEARNLLNSLWILDHFKVYEKLASSDGEITDLRITARYGADIRDQWPTHKGYSSHWATTRGGSTYQSGVSTMPYGDEDGVDDKVTSFWMTDEDGRNAIVTNYYLEALNGAYVLDHSDSFLSDSTSWKTTKEEYYAITGFTVNFDKSTPRGAGYKNVGNNTYEANIYYTRNSYAVTLTNGSSSTALAQDAVKNGIKYQASISGVTDNVALMVPDGYVFKGWYTDEYGKYPFIAENATMPAGNLILYAIVEPKTYKVTFDPQGGTLTPSDESIQVPYNQSVPAESRPTAENGTKTFMGWYLQTGMDDAGKPVLADTLYSFETPVTKDITLVAKWYDKDAPHYTITYEVSQDGKAESAPTDSRSYTEGASAQIGQAAVPADTSEKVFLGWKLKKPDGNYGDLQKPGEEYVIVKDDAVMSSDGKTGTITFVAEYGDVDTTYITWNGNGGTTGDNLTSIMERTSINKDVAIKGADTFTRTHYEFMGWAYSSNATVPDIKWNKDSGKWTDASGNEVSNVAADLANNENNFLYAVWKLKTWHLTLKKELQNSPYVDPNKPFTFDVSYTDANGKPQTKTGVQVVPGTPALLSDDNGNAIEIYDGSVVTVTETTNQDFSVVSHKAYPTEDGSAGAVSGEGATQRIASMDTHMTVEFINQSKIVPGGVSTTNAASVAMLVSLLGLACAAFVLLKVKRTR